VSQQDTFTKRAKQARRVALELFRAKPKPDWVTFFREVLGVDGVVNRLFPQSEIQKFHATKQYHDIHQMLGRLRTESLNGDGAAKGEKTQMITPRLPASLHRSLVAEVQGLKKAGYKMSLNQLVIMKCCVPIDPLSLPPLE
jgi:hypothetical protein